MISILKRILLFIFLILIYANVLFSVKLEYPRETPLYLRNFVDTAVLQITDDLNSIWGFELELPVNIIFEKEYGLSAKGEAVMYPDHHEIILSPSATKIPELLRHEFMHLYTFEWMYENNYTNLPLWFIEGIAVWYERRSVDVISKLDPFNTWKETDFLDIKEYPSGDAFSRYYDFLSDFFYRIDEKINLRNEFQAIMKDIPEKGNIHQTLSEFLKTDFSSFHSQWRIDRMLVSLGGFIFVNLSYIIPAAVIFFLGLFTLMKNRNIKDTFTPDLEKKFGKNYWKKE